MADPLPYPDSSSDTDNDTRLKPDRGSTISTPPSTPRWVKVFVIIVIALALLLVIMMFAGGGSHGPGRHTPSTPSGDAGGDTLLSIVTEDYTPSDGDLGVHTLPIAHGVQQP